MRLHALSKLILDLLLGVVAAPAATRVQRKRGDAHGFVFDTFKPRRNRSQAL